jgi:hypothetical protein
MADTKLRNHNEKNCFQIWAYRILVHTLDTLLRFNVFCSAPIQIP